MLEKNIKLLARLLHNPDLLRQPIKPGSVDLAVRGLDLPLQRCALVRRASFGELFMREASIFSTRETMRAWRATSCAVQNQSQSVLSKTYRFPNIFQRDNFKLKAIWNLIVQKNFVGGYEVIHVIRQGIAKMGPICWLQSIFAFVHQMPADLSDPICGRKKSDIKFPP
jgi:hypothetical protein